jgi:hypothetical protein
VVDSEVVAEMSRLRFLIDFAQMDLDTATPGEMLDVTTDVAQIADPFGAFDRPSKEELVVLQAVIQDILLHGGKPHAACREDAIGWLAYLELSHSRDTVRQCPECGRFFERVKKAKYCSRYCTNKVCMRRYLSNPANRERHNEACRNRYRKARGAA